MSSLSIASYFPFTRVKVIQQTVHGDGPSSALIRLEPDQRCHPLCHDCGSPATTVHSKGHVRIIRDLNMASAQTTLQVGYRRVWCDHCGGARTERLSFADAGKRVTHRLARYVYDLCKTRTITEVARHLDLDPKTVKAIDQHFLEQDFGQTDYGDLRILAVDEISLTRGQDGYMTVVLDYISGRVVWMGQGRKSDTLDSFFAGMTQEQKDGIGAVAMDMWEGFVKSVRNNCPKAKIVFDFFHVVKGYGEVIDEVRRQEFARADADNRDLIKGSRYLLLANSKNLTHEGRVQLKDLLEANKRLNAVYILKDNLKHLYGYKSASWAKAALEQWCELAAEVDHPLMKRFIGRLRYFEYGILNHCLYPIGTSKLEGVNNKIKVIKRKAYGFHDPHYFTLKVKQAFPGKLTTETG
jgi:transposase